jgi:hypothetical protein
MLVVSIAAWPRARGRKLAARWCAVASAESYTPDFLERDGETVGAGSSFSKMGAEAMRRSPVVLRGATEAAAADAGRERATRRWAG